MITKKHPTEIGKKFTFKNKLIYIHQQKKHTKTHTETKISIQTHTDKQKNKKAHRYIV